MFDFQGCFIICNFYFPTDNEIYLPWNLVKSLNIQGYTDGFFGKRNTLF